MIDLLVNGDNLRTKYGLFLTDAKVEAPEVRTLMIEVAGRDGMLDLTQSIYGDAPLGMRPFEYTLAKSLDGGSFDALRSALMADYHGKKYHIQTTDDTAYLNGYLTVECERKGNLFTATISGESDPYRIDGNGGKVL